MSGAGWRSRLLAISELGGWKRTLAAAGFGALLATAFAPLRFFPVLLIALPGFALLLEGAASARRPRRAAFLTGAAFGTAFFALGIVWVANAFLVQAEEFAWMIPVALPLLFGGLGAFFGLAALFQLEMRRRLGLRGAAALLPLFLGLTGAEWLRGHILTGFPWNLTAQSVAGSTVLLQPLSLLGPYGYGAVLTALALLPAAALLSPGRTKAFAVAGAALFGALAVFGLVRSSGETPRRGDVRVAIVQPNLAQRDKLDSAKRLASLRQSLEMSERAAAEEPLTQTYAIWPENAFPFIAKIPDLPEVLRARLPAPSFLLTGSIREVGEDGYANTFQVFGPAGEGARLAASYDKHRLVPFGETLPFYEVFEALGIESLSPAGAGGFTPGPGPVTIAAGRAPFAPLICYEDIFPGHLYPAGERPDWLVVVTNDGWFGDAAGPEQHLDIARMRAAETGLPIARSANTGISALIGPRGNLLHTMPLYQQGVIAAALPAPLPPTLYTRWGESGFILIFIGAAVAMARARRQVADPAVRG